MKNVLIIEDDERFWKGYRDWLEWRAEVEFVWSKDDATKAISKRIRDVIAFDLVLIYKEADGKWKDTIDLTETLKSSWTCRNMIATSSEEIYRVEQMKAWCNSQIKHKRDLVEHILTLI